MFCPQCGFDLIKMKLDPELRDSLLKDWLEEEKVAVRRVAFSVLLQKAREQKDDWRQAVAYSMELHQISEKEIEEALRSPQSMDFRSTYELALEAIYRGDLKNALQLAFESAKQGDPQAQCLVGGAFLEGQGWGVPVNRAEAVSWLTKSAAQLYAPAQYQLGVTYEEGQGAENNAKQAKDWFRRAARQGYALAEFRLGEMSYEENDVEQTFKWFERAAYRGYCVAQYNLGVLYENGLAVEQNLVQAEYWWRKAAGQRYEDALEKLRQGNFAPLPPTKNDLNS